MGMGGSGARIKSILAMLREEDEGQHLAGLNELCEYLAVATEETMVSFPIDQTVPILINFLGQELNPDVMLLAARALTNLADVFPPACSYIIRHGAVSAFCARLLNIEYIDLAEQSLQALEKLSHEHPGSLLRAGALVAVLSYVDFFQTGVQRVAVATAANICRGLSTEHVDAVSTTAPILIGLLSYADAKIVDSACLALTRIADAFSRSPEHMEMLVSFGLINSIVELVKVSDTGSITSQLSGSTFYGLVKLLATCASASHVVAERLLQAGISGTLNTLLMTSPVLSATLASPGNALRSADQLQDLVSLANQLLPSIPDAFEAVLTSMPAPPVELTGRAGSNAGGSPSASRPPTTAALQATALAVYLQGNPEAADAVAEHLLAVMLKVHASGGTVHIKKLSRTMLAKLLYHTSPPTLSKLLSDLPISSLVARLLRSKDPAIAAEGMQMADILLEKLQEEYSRYFLKEGVVHAMEELAATAVEVAPAPVVDVAEAAKEKYGDKKTAAVKPTTTTDVTAPTAAALPSAGATAQGGAGLGSGAVGTRKPSLTRRRTRSMAPEDEQPQSEEQSPAVERPEEDHEEEEEPDNLGHHRARLVHNNQRTHSDNNLRNALANHAKMFCSRYFTDAQGNSLGCRTQGVLVLEKICERLPDPAAVQELLTALAATGETSISTFEFLSSGTLRKLRGYLQGEGLPEVAPAIPGDVESPEETRRWQNLERLAQFSRIALPPGSGGSPPLVVLVEKIQAALAAAEKFEVHTTDIAPMPSAYSFFGGSFLGSGRHGLSRSTGDASGSLSAGLAALSNPFKIRLSRHPSAAPSPRSAAAGASGSGAPAAPANTTAAANIYLKDYTSNVVLIEPLASMNQVEEFLWPRVQYTPGEQARMFAGGDEATRAAHGRGGRDRGGGESAAAQAAVAGGTSGSGPRATSRSRSIPQSAVQNNDSQGRRLTRAQARAAAEAEVAAQGVDTIVTTAAAGDGDTTMAEGNQHNADVPPKGAASASAELARAEATAAADAAAAQAALFGGIHEGEIESDEDYDDEDMEEGYVEDDFEEDGKLKMKSFITKKSKFLSSNVFSPSIWKLLFAFVSLFSIAEDDMLDAAAMHVHDMHIGTEEETQQPRETSTQPSPSSARVAAPTALAAAADAANAAGERSYAGAAAAGTPAAATGDNPHIPRLAFYLNGRLLEPSTTIFQAVRAEMSSTDIGASGSTGPSFSSGRSLGSRLWGDVHTLTYRPYKGAIQERDAAAATAAALKKEDGGNQMNIEQNSTGVFDSDSKKATSGLLSSPLAELLLMSDIFTIKDSFTGTAPGEKVELAGCTPDCLDALVVLTLLESVNRLAQHLNSALEGRQGRTVPFSGLAPGHVPREVFISGRLGPKLAQQLKDVISICGGSLPPWCSALSRNARFLFPFENRRRLFYCTSFGLSRALFYLQQANVAENGPGNGADRDMGSLRISRVQRQKVRIYRNRILESAHRVFELYAGTKSQLEVEFFDEAGSGLGPTMEFYTLVSHEIQRRSLKLWRDEGTAAGNTTLHEKEKTAAGEDLSGLLRSMGGPGPGPLRGELFLNTETRSIAAAAADSNNNTTQRDQNTDLVLAPLGLFPRPLPPGRHRSETSSISRNFRLLGRFVAKALQDCRLLDLPLSPVLYRLILGRKVDLHTLRAVDPALSTSLERLHAAERAVAGTGRAATVDGCSIDDLCLTFVLPGFSKYELCPGGADVAVTSSNLRQYIDAVVDATLGSGVATQVEAFRTGFSAIFSLSSLEPFYEDEIEAMLCGTGEAWTAEGLSAVIKFDHGYNATSAPIVALLEVLAELDAVDQRRFLRFVTGTPRLPPGGVASLQPKLTVVRKLSTAVGPGGDILGTSAPGTGGETVTGAPGSEPGSATAAAAMARTLADGDLPSVMTCANYLKLPPYSSKEVLKERLLFAIREGQGSFDLS